MNFLSFVHTSRQQVECLSSLDPSFRDSLLNNTHFISISTPGEREARLPEKASVLRLSFDDLELDDIEHDRSSTEAYFGRPLVFFDVNHATAVKDFVESRLHLTWDTFVINCEAGVSRSVGLMCALKHFYLAKDVRSSYPAHNKHVYNVMYRLLKKGNVGQW